MQRVPMVCRMPCFWRCHCNGVRRASEKQGPSHGPEDGREIPRSGNLVYGKRPVDPWTETGRASGTLGFGRGQLRFCFERMIGSPEDRRAGGSRHNGTFENALCIVQSDGRAAARRGTLMLRRQRPYALLRLWMPRILRPSKALAIVAVMDDLAKGLAVHGRAQWNAQRFRQHKIITLIQSVMA